MEGSRLFESPLDQESQTLLDIIYKKNRAAGKKVAVHQLVYIGKLREESTSQKAADHIHKTIKMLHEKYLEIGGGTGLLLFQGSYFVHQIELDLCSILEELTERVPQLIPKEETLQSVLQQAIFLTPKDFISRFLLPRNKTLESDITWPAPIRLIMYILKDN